MVVFTKHLNNKSKLREQKNAIKKAKKRAIVEGYPKTEPFKSYQEVADYLSGDKVICLLCGKPYRILAPHLSVHQVSIDEYKTRFAIPIHLGLSGTSTKETRAEQMRARHQSGEISIAPARMKLEEMKALNLEIPARQKPYYHQKYFMDRGAETAKLRAYPDHIYDEYLARLSSGRSVQSVTKDEDMPCDAIIRRRMEKDPDFRAKYEAIVRNRRGLRNLG